ncbi:hypothetical protein L1987_30313 [Smallanthus sonchifolius]|uniref:Uncharacterized protein n=1 Tax=Smallanthus sonchifolius TaxID=185202 RepID=A0ACB9I382_9ASTR|nr:hypothetical protein L1987_30313 [Smallanthus sonchifolius]
MALVSAYLGEELREVSNKANLSIAAISAYLNELDMSNVLLKPDSDSVHIREVGDDNLVEDIVLIRQIVDDYLYIAMDIEFPVVVL